MRCFAMFSVAKVVNTLGPEPGIAESLDDFRYKRILNGVGCHRYKLPASPVRDTFRSPPAADSW
jgi:hypothetical protein